MFYCQVNEKEYIFEQGDDANSFFIAGKKKFLNFTIFPLLIESGKLEVYIETKFIRELKRGDGFGELALLYSAPRSASIKAVESCKLWGIDRETFKKAVKEITTKAHKENRSFIENVKFFRKLISKSFFEKIIFFLENLTSEQKDAISHVLINQKFFPNQNIVNEGDQASSFYIIMEVLKFTKKI